MSNQKSSSSLTRFFAGIVILLALVVGHLIFYLILGDPANFDAEGHPKEGNIMAVMYKGGMIVPILLALLITVITIGIERFITIQRAKGRGSIEVFVRKIKGMLASGQIDNAIAECDKQQGSLANVMRSGLERFKTIQNDPTMDKEAKEAASRPCGVLMWPLRKATRV